MPSRSRCHELDYVVMAPLGRCKGVTFVVRLIVQSRLIGMPFLFESLSRVGPAQSTLHNQPCTLSQLKATNPLAPTQRGQAFISPKLDLAQQTVVSCDCVCCIPVLGFPAQSMRESRLACQHTNTVDDVQPTFVYCVVAAVVFSS